MKVLKVVWRAAKVILGAVACVGLVGVGGYYVSMGLNWLTGVIMKLLATAAGFLTANWVAILVAIVAILLGAIAFEFIVNWASGKRKEKATAKATAAPKNHN